MVRLRKKVVKNKDLSKKLIVGFFLLLVLSTGIWYIYSNENQNNPEDVAVVNGESITIDDINNIQEAFSQQGKNISSEEAIEQAINEKLLLQEARESFSISLDEAETFLQEQLINQNMSLEEYKQELELQNFSYEDELENLQNQLMLQNYLNTAFENESSQITEEEISNIYDQLKKQYSEEELPPLEELKEQIRIGLQQQKQSEKINSLIQDLKEKANITYIE